MAGISNEVLYGSNVDFTGGSPVTGQMTANGMLLIGSAVAPFIRAATLTAGSNITITNAAGSITIAASGGGGGSVNSVSGTANRITSTGGTDPVIDISASYVGQSSITTLGTISTGTWAGTTITENHGGTAQSTYTTGDILYASGANTLAKLAIGSSTQVLTVTGGVPVWSAAGSGTVTSVSGTANRITSTGGATPVIDISASYVGQSSITTLGTIATGVWQGTKVAEGFGGTNQSTYTTGDLLYASGANTLAKLAIGSSTQVLTVTGGVPVWAAASGGVSSITGTANQIVASASTGAVTLSLSSTLVAPGTLTSTTLFTASAGQVVAVNNQTGTSYTVLVTDFVVSFNNAAAVAVTLPTSPATGQMFRLKDASGAASLQNITITPAAGNIDGSATYVINNNYGSVDLVYSGTKWFVL